MRPGSRSNPRRRWSRTREEDVEGAKMMRRWRPVALAVTLAMVGGVALSGSALAQSSGTSSPTSNKIVLRVGVPGDMISPNPLLATNGDDYETLFNAYDLLFNFNPDDLSPIPGLATACDPSADYKTWTCTIRSGVTWSDGQPLTAEDVAFTYRFIETTDENEVFTSYIPYHPTFSAPNATTLIWKSPKPTFAPTIPPWVPILPEHIWKQFEGNGKAARAFANVPAVGSGPFVLTSWDKGQGWTMEANKSYWGGAPAIDEIHYIVYDSQEAMVQALKSGQIDFADNLNPTLFNSLQGQPNIGTVKGTASTFTNLAFNFGGQGPDATNNPVLKDLNIRKAIAMGIDKQSIIDKVWQGDAEVGSVVTLPSHMPWFFTPTDTQSQAYDPAAANTLLDQSGYANKDASGIRQDKNGKPIVLNVITLPEETGSVDTGKLIAAQLQQIGIGVKLQSMSDKQITNNNWYTGDFDAYVWGWGGDQDVRASIDLAGPHGAGRVRPEDAAIPLRPDPRDRAELPQLPPGVPVGPVHGLEARAHQRWNLSVRLGEPISGTAAVGGGRGRLVLRDPIRPMGRPRTRRRRGDRVRRPLPPASRGGRGLSSDP
ncbi:MAG: ABC transporter substrate-binding protein [Actinobacteria bacterium]|nr:MAG: ABC transporter substrate-binding protein [Actinomycetota bacterium]